MIISFAYFTYSISLADFTLSDGNYSYLGGMTWYRSAAGLEKGFEIAQQENKPILMYFWAIWCQNCSKLQSDTFTNPQVRRILKEDYILVVIDLDIDRKVAHKYNVSYPPYVVLLDKNGNLIERVAGTVEPDTFLPIVTQARNQIRDK